MVRLISKKALLKVGAHSGLGKYVMCPWRGRSLSPSAASLCEEQIPGAGAHSAGERFCPGTVLTWEGHTLGSPLRVL